MNEMNRADKKKEFNVIGIISSSRNSGNTAALVREALKGAEEGGAKVKEVFLPKLDINFCIGCTKCLSDGDCPFKDDFAEIRALIYQADGIIFGSPTYCGTYNAIMKNLFERLGMFEVMTSNLGGKYLAGISTAGSAMSAKKAAKNLISVAGAGVFKRSYISGTLGAGFVNGNPPGEDPGFAAKARQLGLRMSQDIVSENHYPLQRPLPRLVSRLFMKPMFSKFIARGKERDTKAVYQNLVCRGLI